MTWHQMIPLIWRRYLVAILIIIIVSALQAMFFEGLGRGIPYLTYYPAVMLAALYGGLHSGLLASAFSAFLCFYWIQKGAMSPVEWLDMGVFLISCSMISGITEAMHRAQTRVRQETEALRKSEERFRELSIIDNLTQLYNSRHFYSQLKIEVDRAMRYEQPLTLLIVFDIDNFRAFNDTYGHVEGEQVLSRLGPLIKSCLRRTDSAYRYGDEEFTIILPMTTSADGAAIAERIRKEFKNENFSPVLGKEVHMTLSMRIAQYDKEDIKDFVNRVDQLMYKA